MNAPVLLGILLIGLSVSLFYGLFQLFVFTPRQVETIALFLFPGFSMFAGIGLCLKRDWGRYLGIFLCFFCFFLGLVSWLGYSSVVYYLPIVPLMEHLPLPLFQVSVDVLRFIFLIVIPVLVIIVLAPNRAGFAVPEIGRKPLLVLVSAGMLFSFALLFASQIVYFLEPPQVPFLDGFSGFPLSVVLRHFEFIVPLMLSFALLERRTWAYASTFGFTAYFLIFYVFGAYESYYHTTRHYFFWLAMLILGCGILALKTRFFFKSGSLEYRPDSIKARPGLQHVLILVLIVMIGMIVGYIGTKSAPHVVNISNVHEVEESEAEAPIPIVSGESFPDMHRLEGVLKDAHEMHAIIDGQILKTGDKIKGFTLILIENSRVQLESNGIRYWLDDQGRVSKIQDNVG